MTTNLYLGAAARISGYNFTSSFRDLMFGGASNLLGDLGTGQLASRRCYNGVGDGIPTWSQSAADTDIIDPWDDSVGLGCKGTWISMKPDVTDFNNGVYDAAVVAFIASIPINHRVLWSLWHEPEDNFTTAAERLAYRTMMKRFHRLVASNRGSVDVWAGPVWKGLLFDEISAPHEDISAYWPVYESGDSIPAGFSIGDAALDFVGIDFYDRDRNWATANRAWDPLVGGNPLGLTGYIDKIVTEMQLTKPTATRADVVYALGEIGTKRGRTDDDPYTHPDDPAVWFAEIVENAIADDSICLQIDWFHNNTEGEAAPWDMQDEVQDWIRVNGTEFVQGVTAIGVSIADSYNVAAGTSLVSNTLELRWATAGLVTQTLELEFSVTGIVNNEVLFQFSTEQELPILPDAIRGIADAGRLQSGSPNARRPSSPGAGPT